MSPSTASRTRMVSLGLLVGAFLVGALAGVAGDRLVLSSGPETTGETERVDSERDGDRGGDRNDGEQRDRRRYVIDEVEMAADQRAAIDTILKRRSERLRERRNLEREEWESFMGAITDSARVEINAVLTPEQRADYERRLMEMRERFRDREDHRRESRDSAR